jgi:hypothetical protein
MATKAIRYWLMKRPRPTTVRVVVGKDVSEMQFDPRTSFARTAESLDAMDADRLEALDLNGKLIRACKPAEMEDSPDAEPEAEPPPEPTTAVSTDPETARFVLVANLIADAYKHSNEVAFARLVDIFDRSNKRSENVERSLDHMRRLLDREAEARLEEAEDAVAEAKENPLSEMAGAFMGALKGGAGDAPATDAPNGKGNH